MKVRTIVAALFALLMASSAQAQQKVQIGCTATGDCASAMVAIDEGIFKRLGLDAEMVLIGLNSNIPAALLSNSIQIGGPTSSVFLQAVDGGLDLVAVGGASAMNERTANLVAVVGRTGVNLKEPKDFVGKKVGAPGLGAFLHVLFVKWLMDKGVDPKGVNFVEVSFPTMNDILKSGAIDAVLAGEPFITRIEQGRHRHRGVPLPAGAQSLRAGHFLCGLARLGAEESGSDQEIPRGDRRRREDRQLRPRQGGGIDLEIHQAAAGAAQDAFRRPIPIRS